MNRSGIETAAATAIAAASWTRAAIAASDRRRPPQNKRPARSNANTCASARPIVVAQIVASTMPTVREIAHRDELRSQHETHVEGHRDPLVLGLGGQRLQAG